MSEALTPELLRERVLAIVEKQIASPLAVAETGDQDAMDVVLIALVAYARGWRDAGGDFDPLTMLEAGLA